MPEQFEFHVFFIFYNKKHENRTFRASLEPWGPRDPPWMQERQILFRIALTRALYDQTAPQLCLFYVPGLVIEKSRSRAHAQENCSRISAQISDFSPMLELLCKFNLYCYFLFSGVPQTNESFGKNPRKTYETQRDNWG